MCRDSPNTKILKKIEKMSQKGEIKFIKFVFTTFMKFFTSLYLSESVLLIFFVSHRANCYFLFSNPSFTWHSRRRRREKGRPSWLPRWCRRQKESLSSYLKPNIKFFRVVNWLRETRPRLNTSNVFRLIYFY